MEFGMLETSVCSIILKSGVKKGWFILTMWNSVKKVKKQTHWILGIAQGNDHSDSYINV